MSMNSSFRVIAAAIVVTVCWGYPLEGVFTSSAVPNSPLLTNGAEIPDRYVNSGVFMAKFTATSPWQLFCSGTLIDDDVFLTAGHCAESAIVRKVFAVGVSFEPRFDPAPTLVPRLPTLPPGGVVFESTLVRHPNFVTGLPDPSSVTDVAVLLMHEAVPRHVARPAKLPRLGLIDSYLTHGTIAADGPCDAGDLFGMVGYGLDQGVPGTPTVDWDRRRFSTAHLKTVYSNAFDLTIDSSRMGTNDSGGAAFHLGSGCKDAKLRKRVRRLDGLLLVSVIQSGVTRVQRLDIPIVRDFLAQFVDLGDDENDND